MISIFSKIFGYILGDGWIDIHLNAGASGDIKGLNLIKKDINSIIPNSCSKIKSRKTVSEKYNISGTSNQFSIRNKFTKILLKRKMPIGKRVEQQTHIPNWILNGNLEIKRNFISGFYAAEGYIPSFQKNNKTPKTPTFCFYKSKEFDKNADKIANDFCKILSDLSINAYIKTSYKKTKNIRIVKTIVISNDIENYINFLNLLDLSYCYEKEQERKKVLEYLLYIEKLKKEKKDFINFIIKQKEKMSYTEIEKKYGVPKYKVERILNGTSHGKKNTFIDYKTYCSTKTPLNNETPKKDNDVPSLLNNNK